MRYEPPTALRSRMIDLGTLAGLLKHNYRLDAYCPRCDRWHELPLGASWLPKDKAHAGCR